MSSQNAHIILEHILDEVRAEFDIETSNKEFFGYFAALQLLKNLDITHEEIQAGDIDGTLDGGIDFLYLFINGELFDWTKDYYDLNDKPISIENYVKDRYKKNIEIELFIIQTKYENSFNEKAITTLKTSLDNCLNLSEDLLTKYKNRYNESVLNFFTVFQKVYLSLITRKCAFNINICYASKGADIHENVHMQADELKKLLISKLPNQNISFDFYGAERLNNMYQTVSDTDFSLNLSENIMSDNRGSYVALTTLANIYNFFTKDHKIIRHIFESNVRDYQGANNVNTEISITLEKQNSDDFWWFNNGITILCSEVKLVTNKQISIKNPEIVNGLQTSTEIYNYFKKFPNYLNTDTRNVLIKIVVPETEEIRDEIIKTTNNQTLIPKSSLRATDPVHRNIEILFKSKGLFYDRRKNYYKNLGRKPKEIVSIAFMSQCLISILMQKPDYARARPSSLLDEQSSYELLFSPNTNLNVFYLIAIFGKKIEENLRTINGLKPSQSSDIKFHVLFASTALATKKSKIYANDIEKLTDSSIDKYIYQSITLVKNLYLQEGGTNKVVKSSDFRELLISTLEKSPLISCRNFKLIPHIGFSLA